VLVLGRRGIGRRQRRWSEPRIERQWIEQRPQIGQRERQQRWIEHWKRIGQREQQWLGQREQ
jgi:hypothetical protein